MDLDKKPISEIDEKHESLSEIDKRLKIIKNSFDENYKKWEKKSKSNSRHGNMSKYGDPPTLGDTSSKKEPPKANCRPMANCMETESDLPDHQIHGFVNETLFLKNFLLKQKESKEFKALAIVGKHGVGKTTLCQSVFNDADVKQAYFPRIWLSMYSKETKGDHKLDVVKRILRSLGVEDKTLEHIKTEAKEDKSSKQEANEIDKETVYEMELSHFLNALHVNLIGKKYLIVLDDVREYNNWNERLNEEKNQQEKPHLSCGFPKEFGGKVIVTTIDESLAKKIVGEEENLQRLFPRSDAESIWDIYQDARGEIAGDTVAANGSKAKPLKVNPRYPDRFKQDLMDKSCGLPSAARMLAKIEPVEIVDKKEGNMDRKESSKSV